MPLPHLLKFNHLYQNYILLLIKSLKTQKIKKFWWHSFSRKK
jgi:hypothetical protein